MERDDVILNQIDVRIRSVAVKARIIYPGRMETLSDGLAEQRRPVTDIRLCGRAGGAAADSDDAEPVGEVGRRVGAPKTYRILVDMTLTQPGNIGIVPNFIVIHTKNDAVPFYGLYNRMINSEGDFQKNQRNKKAKKQGA